MTSQKVPLWPFILLAIILVGSIGFLVWFLQQPTKAELAAEAKQAKIADSLALQELDEVNTSKEMIDAIVTFDTDRINKYSTMDYNPEFEIGEDTPAYQPAYFLSSLIGRFNLEDCSEPAADNQTVEVFCANASLYEDADNEIITMEFSTPKKISAMFFTDENGEKVGYK